MHLPPELWSLVISFLPSEDRRICLFVSRFYRDLTLPFLFSHVTIHFGLWKDRREDFNSYDIEWNSTVYEGELETRNSISCEMLWHISTSPSFAVVIKSLSIQAFMAENSFGIFETRMSAFSYGLYAQLLILS